MARKRVSLFITCLGDSYFPRGGIAAVKVLEKLGCVVDFPTAQTCCGQPMYNNGYHADARVLAERMIRVFAESECVVTPSGSCAAMIRDYYPSLFEGDEAKGERRKAEEFAGKTFEFAEFLVKVLKVDLGAFGVKWEGKATYHYSCHLRGLHVTDEAERLMRQVKGLEYVPLTNRDQCCGFGGTFATKYPDISGAMVRDKVAAIRESGASMLVSSEPGCTMNIAGACRRGGCGVEIKSLAEVIAEGMGLMEPKMMEKGK